MAESSNKNKHHRFSRHSHLSSVVKAMLFLPIVLLLTAAPGINGGVEIKSFTVKEAEANKLYGGELDRIQQMRAKCIESEIIKSDDMTPEKSPEEFLERFRNELRMEHPDYRSFVKKATRGLMLEKTYNEKGVRTISRQNVNPNYYAPNKREINLTIIFNRERFCIPTDLLKKMCKEEGKSCSYGSEYVSFYLDNKRTASIIFSYNKNNATCIDKIKFNENPYRE